MGRTITGDRLEAEAISRLMSATFPQRGVPYSVQEIVRQKIREMMEEIRLLGYPVP